MRDRPSFRPAILVLLLALVITSVACRGSDEPDAPELTTQPGTCEVVAYTPATASQEFRAMLCRPAEDIARPSGIVLVHGGGGYAGEVVDVASWEQAYRGAGLTTLSIAYYLHDPESGRQAWPLPEQNVKAGVQFLRLHQEELGIENIVLHGWSAGGRLGGIVYTTPNDPAFQGPELWEDVDDKVDSFIGFYGYYDGQQFYPDTYYGPEGIPPEAVAIDNVSSDGGPVQLAVGDSDYLIPPEQTYKFAEALQNAGVEVNLSVAQDAAVHVFDGYGQADITPQGQEVAEDMVAWYTELIGEDGPDDGGGSIDP
jgi:acetyl esterase/lipase